jgi:hypothetical protein
MIEQLDAPDTENPLDLSDLTGGQVLRANSV